MTPRGGSSLACAALVFASCATHGPAMSSAGPGAEPPVGAALSIHVGNAEASVTLSDTAYVAVFLWDPPGFRLLAPDPSAGESVRLPPGLYSVGTGLNADRRAHLVLLASDRPLDMASWAGESGVAGPDGRVVTRAGALTWLVDAAVRDPGTTQWTVVEDRRGPMARFSDHQAAGSPPPGQAGRFTPRVDRPVDRSGARPSTSQPERPPS